MPTRQDRLGDDERRSHTERQERDWQLIRQAIEQIRFGTITIHVQDGVIVQIDRLEKQRLNRP